MSIFEKSLHILRMLQVGERRLHVSVAQNGPRFQKSAPRGFEQPSPPYGTPMNVYPPSFPVGMPNRFPVPVRHLLCRQLYQIAILMTCLWGLKAALHRERKLDFAPFFTTSLNL